MNAPFLVVDTSPWNPSPNFEALLAHPHVVGVILKATQGTYYAPQWFRDNWSRVREVAGSRYGDTWFRGAYHFLDCTQDGAQQADYYLAAIERAGGWSHGDIVPIVDVERGGPNGSATAREVIDTCTAFANRVKHVTGRKVMLYGRGIMRDLGIQSRMGCDLVWNPSYTATMVTKGLVPSWDVDDVALWQYTDGNAGDASVHGLPLGIPGFNGAQDVSVVVDGARKVSLGTVRRKLLGSALDFVLVALLLLVTLAAASWPGGNVATR